MIISGFEAFVARRLSTGGKNSVASVIAVAGVCCAVAIMILTLAVSMGFKNSIRAKLSGFNADVVVQPPYDYNEGRQMPYLQLTPDLIEMAKKVSGKGVEISKVFRQPGILKTPDDFSTLIFTGFDSGHNSDFEQNNIVAGVWPDYSADSARMQVVVSQTTADKLGLRVGYRVDACFFANDRIVARKFTIAGLYKSNFGDFDNTVSYASPVTLRRICAVDSTTVTALEVRGLGEERAPRVAQELQERLIIKAQENQAADVPVVDNITHTGIVYLSWLKLLDTNVVVIFALMCAVAVCTLISSLFILILNNIPAIGLLRATGATRTAVRNIFVYVSMKLVGAGLILGNVLALLVIWIQATWHVLPLNPEMYYLDSVPVTFSFPGIIAINIAVIIVSWLTLILPAGMAGKISPARTMRYE